MAQRLIFDGRVEIDLTLNNDGTVGGQWRLLETELEPEPAPVWINRAHIDRAANLTDKTWSSRDVRIAFNRLFESPWRTHTKEAEVFWRRLRLQEDLHRNEERDQLDLLILEEVAAQPGFAHYYRSLSQTRDVHVEIIRDLMPYLRRAVWELGAGTVSTLVR